VVEGALIRVEVVGRVESQVLAVFEAAAPQQDRQVLALVADAVSRMRVSRIHLCFAGPAGCAGPISLNEDRASLEINA
jgi:hypothetical protein